MKSGLIIRKGIITAILVLGAVMLAKPPAIPVRQPKQQTQGSGTVIQAFVEEKGEATSQSFSYTFGKAMLFGEEGAMEKDTSLSILGIDSNGLPPMTPGMVNVTGEYDGFRMLPHGMRFNRDITITLPYDSLLIPAGYTPADIRTYYYDEGYAAWRMVEFDRLDVDRQCVVSKVNHFTDFINAIIKTPEVSETTAFVPTMMNDLECANPLSGIPIIDVPIANNMGSACFSYPINIPDGRAGMQPQLSVTYNNNGGSGWMGEGWDLTVSCISIDTRWGVPRFDSQKESEIYMLDGKQLATKDTTGFYQPLPNRGEWVDRYPGPKRFYLHVEGDFKKIVRYGNAPNNYYWEVTDKDGTINYYGKPVDGNGDSNNIGALKNLSDNIVRWYLTETKDTDGNIVRYYYDHYTTSNTAERAVYLRRINYTGHNYNGSVENGVYDIIFDRERMSDLGFPTSASNCRNGLVETNDQLLTKISVKKGNDELLANYFCYKTGKFGKTLLNEISLSPRNNSGSNVLYSFSYYGENDGTEVFGSETTISINGGSKHFEETDHFSWNIGGSTGAGTGFSISKAFTAGVPFNYSEEESSGQTILIDIDGDGLPELLYREKHGNSYSLKYKKLVKSGSGLAYSGEYPITGTSSFLFEKNTSETVGVEGTLADLSAMYNHTWSQTNTSTYFCDVDADGYPDLVSDGIVYLNTSPPPGGSGRHFKRGDRADYEYLFDTDVNESMFGDTVYVETSYWEPNGSEWVVVHDTIASDSLPLPDFDAVRMWEAPYDGVIRGDYSAHLDSRLDNSRRNDFVYDGARVSIQLNDGQNGQNWGSVLIANDSLFSPVIGGINVHRGDRLFFRVESIRNRKYDYVRWSPKIWYDEAYHQGIDAILDPNGDNPLVFNASKDFLANPGLKYHMPFQGCARVSGTVFITEQLNDTIRVKLHHNNTIVKHGQYNAGNAPCNIDISDSLDISTNDSVWISVECLSNVKWSAIKCDASIIISEGILGSDTVRPEHGDTLLAIQHVIPILTNYPKPILPTTNQTGISSIGTFSIIMTGADTDGTYWLSIKRKNSATPVLLQKQVVIVNGRSDSISTNVNLLPSDTLCFELFTDRAVRYGDVLTASIRTASFDISLGVYGQQEESKRIFGEMNRNWGQFAYQDKGYGHLIDTSLLHLTIDTLLSPTDSLSLYDTAFLNSAVFNLSKASFSMMNADYTHQRQVGPIGQTFVSREGMGNFNPLVFDAALRNPDGNANRSPWVAVEKKSKTNSDIGNVFLACSSSTNSKVVSDYLDLNGDRYPDVLSNVKAQYSKPQGGLSNLIAGYSPFNGDAINTTYSTGMGFNFCGSLAENVRFKSGPNGKMMDLTSPTGALLGGNSNNSNVQSAWLDVNGDGLPDIVTGRETFLNLGYSYAKTPNNIILGSIQEGYSLSGSIEIGFNIVSTSFQGGVGVSSGMTMGNKMYVDINGDGLPDRITVDKPDLTYGSIRSFYNQSGQELGGIESLGSKMKIDYNTGQDFGFRETVSNVMANQSVNFSQSANEAATIAWWIFFVKMFVNEQGNIASGKTWSKWQMMDMNADGLPDLVCQGTKTDRLIVLYNQTGKCNMLRCISSKMHGTTTINYELSKPSEAHPQRIWTMSDLVIDDGHHGDGVDVRHFTFEYDSAYYDRTERESYGFAVVKTHTMVDDKIYRTQTDRYHTEDYLRKGLKYNETLTDQKGNILLERTMDYVPLVINSGTQASSFNRGNVYPALSCETTQYENSPIIDKKTYQYVGMYGNVSHYEHFEQGNSERLVADIHYYRNDSKHIVGMPDSIAVKDEQGRLLRIRACDLDAQTGHVTSVRFYNSSSDLDYILTQYDYTYDSYGNIATSVGPADASGWRMELDYTYDGIFHCLPVTIVNSLGDMSHATYHPLWGKPTSITDINGNAMEYEYDDMGRVLQIRGPFDSQYSIRHHYWFTNDDFATYDCVAKTEHYDCQHPGNPLVVSTRCDALGRVVQTKKEMEIDGVETLQISGHVKYDALGRPDSVYYPKTQPLDISGPDPWYTYYSSIDDQPPTVYTYDELDRKRSVIMPDGTTTCMDYHITNLNGQYVFRTIITDANGVYNETYTDYRGLTLRSVADFPYKAVTTDFTYNTLGELTSVTDPCGAVTKYVYDMLGRRTARDHPDAGLDTYTFDPAGNLTQEQKTDGHHIAYNYHFSRLTDVAFSAFPENDIHYQYGYSGDGLNGAGRVVKMEDGSGFSQFSYDAMGNVSENCRTFVLPAEDHAYTFIMSTEYDTWGRTLSISYPDKEHISYAYGLGGELRSVASFKNGISKSLIDSIHYDKFGDRTAVFYGNGTIQNYAYDPLSRRLGNQRGRTSGNALMQDISYTYDGVGNVIGIENTATAIGTMGGPYTCSYTYDHLNRLTATHCQQGNNGYTEQRTYLDDGRIATYDLNGTRKGYAYNTAHTHTLSNIHTLPNRISEVLLSFGWDAKGNMTAQNDRNGNRRNLLWDERNRLLAVLDNATIGTAAHYVYDAQGERTFKLTGYTNSTGSVETTETYVSLDEPTLYASPYLTATAEGYTKHYFAGTERLASAIGNGGIASIGTHIVDNVALSRKRAERNSLLNRVMGSYPLRVNSNRLDTLYGMTQPGTTAELTFFFHPDHLGSASWITDMSGQPVQHLQYKPFGESFIDQHDPNSDYTERFRFTGKERDAETGYDYFGARYYSSTLGIWLSVDPLSDKYPSLSPYVYCADNPVNVIDPLGMDTAFMDPIARKDFLSAMNTVNSNVNDYTEELSRLKPGSRKYNRKQKQIEKWMKLKADFDYICSSDSPMNTYTSNPANLGENADIAAEDNGFTVTNYNKETNEILSNLIYVKSGRESSYVHENRHSRQSPTMSTYEREVEAFRFQQIYNSRDVQELIDNARRHQYPDDRHAPPIYGIEEMVKYRYGK